MNFFYIFFLFFLVEIIPTSTYSQTLNSKKCCCSNIIETLSDDWKNDSLGNNDFRLKNGLQLLNCKLDSIRIDFLYQKLGKPSMIQKTNGGTEFRYISYDIRTRPKNFDGPSAVWGIKFYIRDNEKNIFSIEEFDIDIF